MNCKSRFAIFGVAALITVAGSLAFAQTQQPPKDKKPTPPSKEMTPPAKGAPPAEGEQPQLPPGWTQADMQACMEAGTPGPMHARLTEGAGVWQGKTKMWMAPGTEAVTSECTSTISEMMDGRFVKCEMAGEMPGMGPFSGFGIFGYDNVAETFQASWIDNCGTGIMTGTGELSSDGKTLTWVYKYHCPITKKQTTMREIDRSTGKDSKTMEMYAIDPKSGKEYKMMEIAFTRKAGTTAGATGTR